MGYWLCFSQVELDTYCLLFTSCASLDHASIETVLILRVIGVNSDEIVPAKISFPVALFERTFFLVDIQIEVWERIVSQRPRSDFDHAVLVDIEIEVSHAILLLLEIDWDPIFELCHLRKFNQILMVLFLVF